MFCCLPRLVFCAALTIVSVSALVRAQDEQTATGVDSSSDAPLATQQELVRDRLRQLEDRMAMLAQLLNEREPEQAQRLREALGSLGERQLRQRLERTLTLLRGSRFDQAGHQQQQVLADLTAVLELLKRTGSDLDELRAERQRLEAAREDVQSLHDEQQRTMNEAEKRAPLDSPADFDRCAAEQRAVEGQARDLHEKLRTGAASEQPCPGQQEVGEAGACMQRAGDEFDRQDEDAAGAQQEQALAKLEEALKRLDDALEQARRTEAMQVLEELIARLRGMLARQHEIERVVAELAERALADWTRSEQLRVTAAAGQEREVTADAEAVLELLVRDGTTVVLPDLMQTLIDDLATVTGQLQVSDLGPRTQHLVAGTITQLEEILAALETRRSQAQCAGSGTCENKDGEPCAAPLLPGAAELKLLRGAQLRINRPDARCGGCR